MPLVGGVVYPPVALPCAPAPEFIPSVVEGREMPWGLLLTLLAPLRLCVSTPFGG